MLLKCFVPRVDQKLMPYTYFDHKARPVAINMGSGTKIMTQLLGAGGLDNASDQLMENNISQAFEQVFNENKHLHYEFWNALPLHKEVPVFQANDDALTVPIIKVHNTWDETKGTYRLEYSMRIIEHYKARTVYNHKNERQGDRWHVYKGGLAGWTKQWNTTPVNPVDSPITAFEIPKANRPETGGPSNSKVETTPKYREHVEKFCETRPDRPVCKVMEREKAGEKRKTPPKECSAKDKKSKFRFVITTEEVTIG